jgi:hypothetical protein
MPDSRESQQRFAPGDTGSERVHGTCFCYKIGIAFYETLVRIYGVFSLPVFRQRTIETAPIAQASDKKHHLRAKLAQLASFAIHGSHRTWPSSSVLS